MANALALTAKQARFAQAYALHHNASLAAREASYSPGCASVTGARLLGNASVLERIRVLEAQTAEDMGMSRAQWLLRLQEAAALAKEKREPMAMIAAWREIGKACGFYAAERVRVGIDINGALELERIGSMSDEELLALIAQGAAVS